MDIKQGLLTINSIEIDINDNMTQFLEKIVSLKKRIENINNYYHTYFEPFQISNFVLKIKTLHNYQGYLENIIITIDKNEFDKLENKKLLKYFCNSNLSEVNYDWGKIGIYQNKLCG